MTQEVIEYYLENEYVTFIKCDINCSIGEFLQKVTPKNDNTEHELDYCVYLKGCELEKKSYLKDYFENLKIFPFFITSDPTKLIENSLPIINIDDYEHFKFLKNCSFGHTFQAIDKRTGKEVFIHSILPDLSNIRNNFCFLYQYKIASTLNHCGIVRIFGFRYPLTDEEKKQTKLLKIKSGRQCFDLTGFIVVSEFVKYTSIGPIISEYLKSKGKKNDLMNPTIRSKIIYGIASAMSYVHHKKIYHYNLKIDNILLDENYEPKITGFEYAHYDGYNYENDESPISIDVINITPERFENFTVNLPNDVYAYAHLLYLMFTNKIEYDHGPIRYRSTVIRGVCRGKRFKRPKNMPDQYWELIERCWDDVPLHRPTFDEIVEELKNDKYAIEEYGMKTNLDELHEYQKRIDSLKYTNFAVSQVNKLQKQVSRLESILLPPKDIKKTDNYFIDSEIEKNHEVISKISEGATSITYKVIDNQNNKIMCKKIFKFVDNASLSFKILQDSIKEFEILVRLNHPCICRAIGINTSEVITDPNITAKNRSNSEITTVALFLEYEDYSIQECLNKMNNTLKTKIIIEIAHAMSYIHKNGLIHRDLKIDNIRLNCIFEAKIIDFGLVRIHEVLSETYSFIKESLTKGVGTIDYMSPEMLDKKNYDYKTDVYSFGVIMHFLFVGNLPNQSLSDKLVGKNISMPKPSQSISECCIDIISKCLSYSPSDRPSFDEILRMIRDNSYSLASFVDSDIVSKRDNELRFFEESTK